MHDGWLLVLDVLGILLALLLSAGVGLVVRRRLIARHGGTFEMSLRATTAPVGRGWVLGLGRYTGDSLEWFRIFSLSLRPKVVWRRDEITYERRRAPEGAEQLSLYADHVVVECVTPQGHTELAMTESSVTGFQSWVESGPPGTNWDSKPLR